MSNDRSDLFPNLEFGHYYQLNGSSEAMTVADKESFNSPTSIAAENSRISEKGIMGALGFIAILLVFSCMQLNRSFNTNPVKTKVIRSNRVFSTQELNFKPNNHASEIFAIKNAISLGKF